MAGPVLLEATPFGDSPWKVERWRFDNGLTLLLVEDHTTPVFAYQTWFDVGSANETPGKTGIAHLFEHLLFKQTKTLADGEFDRIMEARGGSTNAATWVDWTYYTSGLPADGDNFELVARLESDRMQNLVLNDAQVEAEREVVLNERRYRVDNSPDGQASEILYDLAFTTHPYRWPTIGWEKDIRAITTADCMEFYRIWYAPNNATVVVVGDVDSARAREVLARSYGAIPSQAIPQAALPVEPAQSAERRRETRLTVEAEKLLVGWHAPSFVDPTRAAAQVTEAIAFAGNSARLRRRLVDEEQIAADLGTMLTPFADPGLLELRVDLREDAHAADAEKLLDEELAKIAAGDVGADELTKAKNQVELGLLSSLRTASDKAEALGASQLTAGDYRRFFGELERVRAVTAAEVAASAQRLFRRENRTVLTVLPQA